MRFVIYGGSTVALALRESRGGVVVYSPGRSSRSIVLFTPNGRLHRIRNCKVPGIPTDEKGRILLEREGALSPSLSADALLDLLYEVYPHLYSIPPELDTKVRAVLVNAGRLPVNHGEED